MDKTTLLNEIRYAERLCQRTARLYRHLQSSMVFMTVLGGSGVMSALSSSVPSWVPLSGACLLGAFGALNLAVRPADKVAANEADAKRYSQLRTAAIGMDASTLLGALNKARETDTTEIESLRDVAYNDVAIEIGRPDAVVDLKFHQNILSAFA